MPSITNESVCKFFKYCCFELVTKNKSNLVKENVNLVLEVFKTNKENFPVDFDQLERGISSLIKKLKKERHKNRQLFDKYYAVFNQQKWSEEKNTSQHQLTDCKKCKNIQSLLLTKPGMKKS